MQSLHHYLQEGVMNVFLVTSLSQLEEAMFFQVQEILLCGVISEQVHAYFETTESGTNMTPAQQKALHTVCRHYDVLDFRGRGILAKMLLSRHIRKNKFMDNNGGNDETSTMQD